MYIMAVFLIGTSYLSAIIWFFLLPLQFPLQLFFPILIYKNSILIFFFYFLSLFSVFPSFSSLSKTRNRFPFWREDFGHLDLLVGVLLRGPWTLAEVSRAVSSQGPTLGRVGGRATAQLPLCIMTPPWSHHGPIYKLLLCLSPPSRFYP